MPNHTKKILVLGAGAWGTALAIHLAKQGHAVTLWDRNTALIERLNAEREHATALPGVSFPPSISPVNSFTEHDVSATDLVIIAVPSHAFASVIAHCTSARAVLWVTKGLDPATGGLLDTIAAEILPPTVPYGLLTGPSFAKEVAHEHPTAVVAASRDPDFSTSVQHIFQSPHFRVYESTDLTGAQIGGAVKNVLAIAVGIASGLGMGANTQSALITRGVAEIKRIGDAFGAEPFTLMGLSGLGDLILTCSDDQSRNRRFGKALGKGISAKQAVDEIGQVVEGIETAKTLYALIASKELYCPITECVFHVVTDQITVQEAIDKLLHSTAKTEFPQ